eukprot:1729053-Prymnesium_polylepis.1
MNRHVTDVDGSLEVKRERRPRRFRPRHAPCCAEFGTARFLRWCECERPPRSSYMACGVILIRMMLVLSQYDIFPKGYWLL